MKTISVVDWNARYAGNILMTYCDDNGNHLIDGFVTYDDKSSAYGEDINASQLAYFELKKKTSPLIEAAKQSPNIIICGIS